MKTLALILLFPSLSWCCPSGTHEDSGACAYDTSTSDSSKWVSNEKPPRTTTGEWQTGKVPIVQLQAQTIDAEAASIQKWTDAHKGATK